MQSQGPQYEAGHLISQLKGSHDINFKMNRSQHVENNLNDLGEQATVEFPELGLYEQEVPIRPSLALYK